MPIITFNVEYEQEEDGKWLAELHDLPSVLVHGQTPKEAILKALALASRVIPDKLEHLTKQL
jgi:predicted RNase H-like HicB family nuclease